MWGSDVIHYIYYNFIVENKKTDLLSLIYINNQFTDPSMATININCVFVVVSLECVTKYKAMSPRGG